MQLAYLEQLMVRLAAGVGRLQPAVSSRIAEYVGRAQRDDGGFSGRDGDSDPYYTGFGLRCLALLGTLDDSNGNRAIKFLRQQMKLPQNPVDLTSLIYSAALMAAVGEVDLLSEAGPDWRRSATEQLESLRREDAGYAKSRRSGTGSAYQTFLTLVARQLLGLELPAEPGRTAEFLRGLRSADGGFRDLPVSKRPGVNPTAAAIGALVILDAMGDQCRAEAASFLTGMQTQEGGFRANTQIPVADLLSTFTGTQALCDLGAVRQIDAVAAGRYVASLQTKSGGFRGGVWDEEDDVEYTFYGLGCLALLAQPVA